MVVLSEVACLSLRAVEALNSNMAQDLPPHIRFILNVREAPVSPAEHLSSCLCDAITVLAMLSVELTCPMRICLHDAGCTGGKDRISCPRDIRSNRVSYMAWWVAVQVKTITGRSAECLLRIHHRKTASLQQTAFLLNLQILALAFCHAGSRVPLLGLHPHGCFSCASWKIHPAMCAVQQQASLAISVPP